MAIQMTDIQTLTVKWTAVDADGNPTGDLGGATLSYALVPPTAGATTNDPSDPTGLTNIFKPASTPGNLGPVQLQISASGGSLAAPITGTFDVVVVASAAASFSGSGTVS